MADSISCICKTQKMQKIENGQIDFQVSTTISKIIFFKKNVYLAIIPSTFDSIFSIKEFDIG